MSGFKKAALWVGGFIAFLVVASLFDDWGHEPATLRIVLLASAVNLYALHTLSETISKLRAQVDAVHEIVAHRQTIFPDSNL